MGLDGTVGSMQITWRRTPSAGEWTEDTSPPPSHSLSSSPSSLSSEEISARRTVPSLDDPGQRGLGQTGPKLNLRNLNWR